MKKNEKSSSSIFNASSEVYPNKSLIKSAFLADKLLRNLYCKRAEIISTAIPLTYLDKSGNSKTVWIDEYNNTKLIEIESLIKFRESQIIKHNS